MSGDPYPYSTTVLELEIQIVQLKMAERSEASLDYHLQWLLDIHDRRQQCPSSLSLRNSISS